ncbi:hypothetical protein FPQ18DRAFT_390588 [Pyronema domesticum]|nr:hypothetical protein FPQ18DRAFT_390588 [Pyronema domesticum]
MAQVYHTVAMESFLHLCFWASGLIELSTTPSEYETSIALKNDPTFPASPMGDVYEAFGWIEDRVDSQVSYSIQVNSTESLLEGKAFCANLSSDHYLTAPLVGPEEQYREGALGECGRCLGCGFQVPRDLVVVGKEVQHLLPASALHLRGASENRVTWPTEVLLAIGNIQYRQDRGLYWEGHEVLYIQELYLWEALNKFPVHFILETLLAEMAMGLRDRCERFQSLLDFTARPNVH